MLNNLRGAAKSWVAKVLIALLVASFAVWGIGDIFISRNSDSIAMVGDREIPLGRFGLALRNQVSAVERQIGRPLTPEETRNFGLDQAAIIQLARQEAIFAEADELGISARDLDVKLAIALNPAFQNALGEFDTDQYRQALRFSGVTASDYEVGQRRSIASGLVTAFAATGYGLPSDMAERLYRFNNETRRFHYVTLGRGAVGDIASASDTELRAHLEANAELFSSPEFRSARYVIASPSALADQMSVTDDEVREFYELRKAFYVSPETRELRRIVYKSADEAETAKAQLAEGASFFDLANDKGLTLADTYVGRGGSDDFETAVAEAAFAEAEAGVIGPVQTDFGPALIEIVSITPGSSQSFEDVQEELAQSIRFDKALDQVLRLETEMADLVAGGADLDLIAGNMGLQVAESPLVDTGGASPEGANAGPAADELFLAALFGAEQGVVTEPFSLSDDSVVSLVVSKVEPPKVRALDQVRSAVAESLRAERLAEALAAKAEDIVGRVNEGVLLAAEADAVDQALSTSAEMKRSSATPDLPNDLVSELFDLDAGWAAWATLDGGARVVIAQTFEVNEPDGEEAEAERLALAARIDALAQQDIQELLTRASVQDRGVSVNESALEQALADIGAYAR